MVCDRNSYSQFSRRLRGPYGLPSCAFAKRKVYLWLLDCIWGEREKIWISKEVADSRKCYLPASVKADDLSRYKSVKANRENWVHSTSWKRSNLVWFFQGESRQYGSQSLTGRKVWVEYQQASSAERFVHFNILTAHLQPWRTTASGSCFKRMEVQKLWRCWLECVAHLKANLWCLQLWHWRFGQFCTKHSVHKLFSRNMWRLCHVLRRY